MISLLIPLLICNSTENILEFVLINILFFHTTACSLQGELTIRKIGFYFDFFGSLKNTNFFSAIRTYKQFLYVLIVNSPCTLQNTASLLTMQLLANNYLTDCLLPSELQGKNFPATARLNMFIMQYYTV